MDRQKAGRCKIEKRYVGDVVVAVINGDLDLGPWEQIFYGEFDGNREKRVIIKIAGE
jgi:thiamine phosphate synthase YjbQ (UPF0047 family)